MNKYFLILILFMVYSCSTTEKANEKRCKSLYWNDFKRVLIEERKSIHENDTIILNEMRFECIKNYMNSTKVMYDTFGIWDEVISSENQNSGMFLWKNVKLFPNENKEFDIATSGTENFETIYTSVMVLSNTNFDYLSDNSTYKSKLINYFGNLIKSNNSKNRDYFEKYWKAINPEHWEKIKKNFED